VGKRLNGELHERFMDGVRGERATPGEFRRTQNWIGAPGCTLNEAEFVPPPVTEMQGALNAFDKYLHTGGDYPPLVRLAFIHYQFEAIHPFGDGNGRIGRLLTSLLLVHWELLPLPLLYLSGFFEQHRQDCIDLLMGVSESGAWREWVEFFLHGVAEQARDASARAKRLQDLQLDWGERLAEARSALPMRLSDSLFEAPVITIPQAQRILDVTYPTAQYNIKKLIEAGILRQVGESSYGRSFVAWEILDIIREDEP
jgi:Fic family protein